MCSMRLSTGFMDRGEGPLPVEAIDNGMKRGSESMHPSFSRRVGRFCRYFLRRLL